MIAQTIPAVSILPQKSINSNKNSFLIDPQLLPHLNLTEPLGVLELCSPTTSIESNASIVSFPQNIIPRRNWVSQYLLESFRPLSAKDNLARVQKAFSSLNHLQKNGKSKVKLNVAEQKRIIYDWMIQQYKEAGNQISPIDFIDRLITQIQQQEHLNKLGVSEYSPDLLKEILDVSLQWSERLALSARASSHAARFSNSKTKRIFTRVIQQAKADRKPSEDIVDAAIKSGFSLVGTFHPTYLMRTIIGDLERKLTNTLKNHSNLNPIAESLATTSYHFDQKVPPEFEMERLQEYFSEVFYESIPHQIEILHNALHENGIQVPIEDLAQVTIKHWGGDRDGNPFVNPQTMKQAAANLRIKILSNYLKDLETIKEACSPISGQLNEIEHKLQTMITGLSTDRMKPYAQPSELLDYIEDIEKTINSKDEIKSRLNHALVCKLLKNLKLKIKTFGFHFASMDVRLNAVKDINPASEETRKNEIRDNLLATLQTIHEIRHDNGNSSAPRIIISNCSSAQDILNLIGQINKFKPTHGKRNNFFDKDNPIVIVPLFESGDDVNNALSIMRTVYETKAGQEYFDSIKDKIEIMLGPSDLIKDVGFLTGIQLIDQKHKEIVNGLKDLFGTDSVNLFVGVGGRPARAGGHSPRQFVSIFDPRANMDFTSQGGDLSEKHSDITTSAHNLAGITATNMLKHLSEGYSRTKEEEQLFESMSLSANLLFKAFVAQPNLLDALYPIIGISGDQTAFSRPGARKENPSVDDIRAIGWSMSMNIGIPGEMIGMGAALKHAKDHNQIETLKKLYKNDPSFQYMFNSALSSYYSARTEIFEWAKNHKDFSEIYKPIIEDAELAIRILPEIMDTTGKNKTIESCLQSLHPELAGYLDMQKEVTVIPTMLTLHGQDKVRDIIKSFRESIDGLTLVQVLNLRKEVTRNKEDNTLVISENALSIIDRASEENRPRLQDLLIQLYYSCKTITRAAPALSFLGM